MEQLPSIEELIERWKSIKSKALKAAMRAKRNPDELKIVAVSKTHTSEMLHHAILAGISVFGENYAQELQQKHQELQQLNIIPAEWHFIGHLQTNKVKYIATFVSMIQSVDSIRLAEEISKQAIKYDRIIDILLQVNTSDELLKSGCEPEELLDLVESVIPLKNIRVKGLMTIGSFSDDEAVYRSEFRLLRALREEVAKKYPGIDFRELSMGMTHDFEAAIEEGATIIRVGTAIFGSRVYK